MPKLLITSGTGRLTVTLGRSRSPGARRALPRENALNVAPTHPASSAVDLIPTRSFLQVVRDRLVNAGATDQAVEKVCGKSFVNGLQQSLVDVGFNILPSDPNNEGEKLKNISWQIREFQIYAKMETVAKYDSTRSEGMIPTTNSQRYLGPVSGLADWETRRLIDLWKRSGFRCPVVVDGYSSSHVSSDGTPMSPPEKQNTWKPEDARGLRLFARDVSGLFKLPDSVPDILKTKPRSIGRYYKDDEIRIEGGRLVPKEHETWASAEIIPPLRDKFSAPSFVGLCLEDLLKPDEEFPEQDRPFIKAKRATFKVIRVVSEFECLGYFDCLQSYDKAALSLGLFHWAAVGDPGELASLIAYCQAKKPEAFRVAFQAFGIGPARKSGWHITWPTRVDRGAPKAYLGLQSDDGSYIAIDPRAGAMDADYLRNWHSLYRHVMAARTSEALAVAMFDLARFRLYNILNSTLPAADNKAIGSVITSEVAVALILRWHIRAPGHIVSGEGNIPYLNTAYAKMREEVLKRNPQPDAREQEKILITSIMEQAKLAERKYANLVDELDGVRNQGARDAAARRKNYRLSLDDRLRVLSEEPGSFALYDVGLAGVP